MIFRSGSPFMLGKSTHPCFSLKIVITFTPGSILRSTKPVLMKLRHPSFWRICVRPLGTTALAAKMLEYCHDAVHYFAALKRSHPLDKLGRQIAKTVVKEKVLVAIQEIITWH